MRSPPPVHWRGVYRRAAEGHTRGRLLAQNRGGSVGPTHKSIALVASNPSFSRVTHTHETPAETSNALSLSLSLGKLGKAFPAFSSASHIHTSGKGDSVPRLAPRLTSLRCLFEEANKTQKDCETFNRITIDPFGHNLCRQPWKPCYAMCVSACVYRRSLLDLFSLQNSGTLSPQNGSWFWVASGE